MLKRLSIGGALLLLCGACAPPDMAPDTDCSACPALFGVAPNVGRILRGDTITFYTFDCLGQGCGSEPNAWSKWSITGNAAAAVGSNGANTSSVANATQILVRADSVGSSAITAVVSFDIAKTVTRLVTVADSAVITSIMPIGYPLGQDTISLGGSMTFLNIVLKDAAGNFYSARPTEWSMSDTSIVALDGAAKRLPGSGEWVQQKFRLKAAGYAGLTIKFLGVSRTLTLRSAP